MIKYPCIIEYQKEEKAYSVSFPDFEESLLVESQKFHKVKAKAKIFLEKILKDYERNRENIPKPSLLKEERVFSIEPDITYGFALWLKWEREKQELSEMDIAYRLRISPLAYLNFEKFRPNGVSIKKVSEIKKALNLKKIVI